MKSEVGSAKWIAKRIKMKGLQSTKWYCQLCAKQCRDEHGYRLHLSSQSHSTQFNKGDSGSSYRGKQSSQVNEWSTKFEAAFVALLRASPRKPLSANKVYNELISDKHHVHLNATRWRSLTSFIKHLDSKGVVQIKSYDPELTVTYIDHEYQLRKEREEQEKGKRTQEYINTQNLILERQLQASKDLSVEPAAIQVNPENHKKPSSQSGLLNPSSVGKIGFSLKRK